MGSGRAVPTCAEYFARPVSRNSAPCRTRRPRAANKNNKKYYLMKQIQLTFHPIILLPLVLIVRKVIPTIRVSQFQISQKSHQVWICALI